MDSMGFDIMALIPALVEDSDAMRGILDASVTDDGRGRGVAIARDR